VALLVEGSPLTVAGAAAASRALRTLSAFPFDPLREPSPAMLAGRLQIVNERRRARRWMVRYPPRSLAEIAENPAKGKKARPGGSQGGLLMVCPDGAGGNGGAHQERAGIMSAADSMQDREEGSGEIRSLVWNLAASRQAARLPAADLVSISPPRRGARVVDRDSLENCCARKGTVGSNPTPSATAP
jgi:hypothetical protein